MYSVRFENTYSNRSYEFTPIKINVFFKRGVTSRGRSKGEPRSGDAQLADCSCDWLYSCPAPTIHCTMRPADLSKTVDLLLNDEPQRDRSNSPLFTVDCGSQDLADCCKELSHVFLLQLIER